MKRMGWLTVLGAVVVAGVMAFAGPAQAFTVVDWNFLSGGATCTGSGCTSAATNFGTTSAFNAAKANVLSFDDGAGHIVNARAYSETGGVVSDAYLGRYGLGLGVVSSTGDNNANIDNIGVVDFIVFQFAQDAYDPLHATLFKEETSVDTDGYVGGSGSTFPSGTYANMHSGFTHYTFDCTSSQSGCASVATIAFGSPEQDGVEGRYLIIAADDTCSGSGCNDEFKIQSLTGGIETAVPEPATMILLGTGLLGLGLARVRRSK